MDGCSMRRMSEASLKGKRKLISSLETILHPLATFNEDAAKSIYAIISSGNDIDEYIKSLKSYDASQICGLVWNANFFAYRCRDCGISPCMSLCADCFLAGNHEGHDFNMFKSHSGGACDCGDEKVMKSSGFCCQHDNSNSTKQKIVPNELISVPKIVIPRLVTSLFEKLKSDYDATSGEEFTGFSENTDNLIDVINKLSQVEVLRKIFCEKIMSHVDISLGNHVINESSAEFRSLVSCEASNGRKIMRAAGTDIDTIEMTVAYPSGSGEPLKSSTYGDVEQTRNNVKECSNQTFLQYFVDVLVYTEFPTKLATLLLQLLPNPEYKETFTRLFCRHYSSIGKSLSETKTPERLSNHIVHVSVQLFSNEFLALRMVKQENLLFNMIFVLSKMVGECLDNFPLVGESAETSIMGVNCDHSSLTGHCYWPIASDLTNLLSHGSVTKIFLETGDYLNRWMHFVTMVTGMNVNYLRLLSHVEYEPRTYYIAFSMEFESVAAVMWEIHRSIIKLNDYGYVLKMLEVSTAAIKDWFSLVPKKLKKPAFTFHLSLQRYFALFVNLAVNHFKKDVSALLTPAIIIPSLNYAISTLCALQEIRAGLWYYNGYQIKCQAQSYMQSYFCNSMLDLDIFFAQMGMLVLDPEFFLDMLIDRYCIRDWFQFGEPPSLLSQEDEVKMLLSVEGFLNTLLTLLTHRVYTGSSEEDSLRKDIIANLSLSDKTHSHLMEVVPGDMHVPGRCFDNVLQLVSDFKSPDVDSFDLQQGMYTPKDEIWEKEFDINHIHLRVYKKSDHRLACKRYNTYVQKKKLATTTSMWPPIRDLENVNPTFKGIFRILKTKKLQQIIIFILYKITKEKNNVTESLVISTVQLLQIMLTYHAQSEKESNNSMDIQSDDDQSTRITESRDPILELTEQYLQTLKMPEENLKIVRQLREEFQKDPQYSTMMNNGNDMLHSDVTFYVAYLYHTTFFESICSYVLALCMAQGFRSAESGLRQTRNLLNQLSDKNKDLLMKLVMYWMYYCHSNGMRVEDLPFITARLSVSKKSQEVLTHVIQLLFENFEDLFQIYSPEDGFPYNAFEIDLPHDNFLDNSFVIFNKHDRYVKKDIDFYVHEMEDGQSTEEKNDVPYGLNKTPTKGGNHVSDMSLLSMVRLLKEHLQEISTPVTPTSRGCLSNENATAGDGVFYVDRILKKFFTTRKDSVVDNPCSSTNSLESLMRAKEERRRKAKERQQLLLAQFKSQQKQFIDYANKEMEVSEEAEDSNPNKCLICGLIDESTEEKPLGLIVVMQASTVLGKRKQNLPINSDDNETCEQSVVKRRKALLSIFDSRSVRSSIECGLDYGINIQTCGHYIHVHCQVAYMKTLQKKELKLIHTKKGEFTCPFCRQISNGLLPVLPKSIHKLKNVNLMRSTTFEQRCADINNFLTLYQQGGLTPFTARSLEVSTLTASISTFVSIMENMTKSYTKNSEFYGADWKWTDKYFILLASLRQIMETDLMYQMAYGQKKSRSCLGDILQVFQFHSQYISSPLRLRWSELCYGEDVSNEATIPERRDSSLTFNNVPLLLLDSQSLLLQFFLTWPQRLSAEVLLEIIQVCYNLTFVQALFVIGINLEKNEKESWTSQAVKEISSLSDYASFIWKYTSFFDFEDPFYMEVEITQSVVSPHTIETKVRESCTPFLRLAWSLLSTWRDTVSDMEHNHQIPDNFTDFAKELSLGSSSVNTHATPGAIKSTTQCLLWARNDPINVIKRWCERGCQIAKMKLPKEILPSFTEWTAPNLIKLPKLYENLFQEYRKRTCKHCNTIPHAPTICLVCGDFLCFHGSCCVNAEKVYECVQHSIDCGCGTGVFLVISTSVTIVIRDSRVSLWGSVYLDNFGEEDRDLKRGRPLFLSEERYTRLNGEWRKHLLDKSPRVWSLHDNRL